MSLACTCARKSPTDPIRPLCSFCTDELPGYLTLTARAVRRAAIELRCDPTTEDRECLVLDVLLTLARAPIPSDRLRARIGDVARWRVADWRRSVRARPRLRFGSEWPSEPQGRPEVNDDVWLVVEAMDLMSDIERRVFYVMGVEQQSREVAALICGLTVHKVRQYYRRAIRIARRVIGD